MEPYIDIEPGAERARRVGSAALGLAFASALNLPIGCAMAGSVNEGLLVLAVSFGTALAGAVLGGWSYRRSTLRRSDLALVLGATMTVLATLLFLLMVIWAEIEDGLQDALVPHGPL